jgi:transcriptional regulator of arginine metabolism
MTGLPRHLARFPLELPSMAVNKKERELRREAVRRLLMDSQGAELRDQKALVGMLEAMGIKATQASISRDLRELGAVWIEGHYEIPEWNDGDEPNAFEKVLGHIVMAKTADQMVFIATSPGAGTIVAEAIEACFADDIVGTVAGYRSVLVLLQHKFFRDLFFDRLKDIFEPSDEDQDEKSSPRDGET